MGYVKVHIEVPFTLTGFKEEEECRYEPISFLVERMIGTNHNNSLLFNSIVGLIKSGKEKAAYEVMREFATFSTLSKIGISHWPLTEEDIAILESDPELEVKVEECDESEV